MRACEKANISASVCTLYGHIHTGRDANACGKRLGLASASAVLRPFIRSINNATRIGESSSVYTLFNDRSSSREIIGNISCGPYQRPSSDHLSELPEWWLGHIYTSPVSFGSQLSVLASDGYPMYIDLDRATCDHILGPALRQESVRVTVPPIGVAIGVIASIQNGPRVFEPYSRE